jgi:formylglycine-generating enzyme required for sulfatase activity
MHVATFVFAFAGIVSGCGRTSLLGGTEEANNAIDDDAGLPPDIAPPLEACAGPIPVPSGSAWIGPFSFNELGETTPKSKCGAQISLWVSRKLHVARFYLDPDEVTNGCYRHCVDAGACLPPLSAPEAPAPWTDPTVERFAVSVDRDRAASFCHFRGGRLPSLAELALACEDSETLCTHEFLVQWIQCVKLDYASAECEHLLARALPDGRPFQPVGSDARDVGPFGHRDLFGSQYELTLTEPPHTPNEIAEYCALTENAPDPKTFSTAGIGYFNFAPAISFKSYVEMGLILPESSSIGSHEFDSGEFPFAVGFRCAYDVKTQP